MTPYQMIAIGVGVVLLVAWLALMAPLFRLWLKATTSNAPIPIMVILGMRFRGIKADQVVESFIIIRKRGVQISILELMDLYQASPREFLSNASRIADEGVLKKK